MKRYYEGVPHPYRIFEDFIERTIHRGAQALLDAGCGRSAPVLKNFRGKARLLVGVDLVRFKASGGGLHLVNAELGQLPFAPNSFDCVFSRSVFEHLSDPLGVYKEIHRILRPGGTLLFLTANMWDYATVVARLVPESWHGRIVKFVEGRDEEDTFPTFYKTNTYSAIKRLCLASGFVIEKFEYLSQYPNYLTFNSFLFFAGTCYEHCIRRMNALRFLRGWILAVLRKPELYLDA